MAFEKFREEWSDMDPKFRWILIAVVALGVVVIGVRAMQPDKPPPVDLTKSAPMIGADGSTLDPNRLRLLPDTPRNQGIEDLTLKVAQLAERIDRSDKGQGGPRFGGGADGTTLPSSVAVAASAAAAASAARSSLPAGSGARPPPIDLGSSLPPNFDAPARATRRAAQVGQVAPWAQARSRVCRMMVWGSGTAAQRRPRPRSSPLLRA